MNMVSIPQLQFSFCLCFIIFVDYVVNGLKHQKIGFIRYQETSTIVNVSYGISNVNFEDNYGTWKNWKKLKYIAEKSEQEYELD